MKSSISHIGFFLPLLLSLLLSGCIEEYDADLPAAQTELLVVEGNICSSQLNTFTITRTIRYSVDPFGEIQEPIKASVAVRGSDGSECVAEETSYGVFRCMLGELSPDVEYWLHIEADGEVYESEHQRPLPTEEIADVHAVQSTPESDIDVIITPDAPAQPGTANYYTWTYDETWEVQPEYTTTIYYDTQLKRPVSKLGQFPERGWMDAKSNIIIIGASRNYQDQHIRGMKIYDISRSSTKVWVKYSGLVHQRAISKGEYEYEMARRQASSEMGGLFTPQPSALPTNIRCLTWDARSTPPSAVSSSTRSTSPSIGRCSPTAACGLSTPGQMVPSTTSALPFTMATTSASGKTRETRKAAICEQHGPHARSSMSERWGPT